MLRIAVLGLLFLVGCSDEGVCTSNAVSGTSDFDFGQCWDGRDRNVHCEPVTGVPPITCTCSVDGNVGRTFTRSEPLTLSLPLSEQGLAPINDGCGWSLRAR